MAGLAGVMVAMLGAGLAVGTAASVVGTLLIPRGRVGLLLRGLDRSVNSGFQLLVRPIRDYPRRDAVLAAQAPVLLLAQLFAWLALFWLAFTALLVPVTGPRHAAREAMSSMLTLGFTASPGGWAGVSDGLAAVTGLVVIALQIGYLPTLYNAYNRRETEVTLLASRAGEPAWGPELLARTHLADLTAELPAFFAAWERLAADLAESHASYPVLLRFRSPRPHASWLVALLAVLDAAALDSALRPGAAPIQGRLCLRMGFLCLRKLAATVGVQVDDDPRPDGPIALSQNDFREGYERLVQAGYPAERTAEQAWPHFRGWRVNYEAAAHALALGLDVVPARWSGPRREGTPAITPVRVPNRTVDDPEGMSPRPLDGPRDR